MQWMSRQFMLPLLLGVSLTGVSVTLIYLWYQTNEDDNRRKTYVETTRQTVIECKVPRQFVPAVIGRGGLTIKDVQNKTATHICFKEDDIERPDRVCVVKGSLEGCHLAEEMIKNIIENQPIIETYEMYVPQKACGAIIGKGGEIIKKIQMSSSAKIMVESGGWSSDPDAQRRIIIKGTTEQIATALTQITDIVQKDKEARQKLESSSASRLPRGKLSPRNTAVNTTENAQSTKLLPLQDADGLMEVYVSAMQNPNQFWIQVIDPANTALDKLVAEMTAYYNQDDIQELHALKNIIPGQTVAAKFSFDEQWYRAEVMSAPQDGYCEVNFVDYGDHENVPVTCILELRTDFLSLRIQAIECSLANVKPRGNEWSTEACEKFADLTWLAQWKVLVAKVRGYKTRAAVKNGKSRPEGLTIPCMDLYDKNDNQNINIAETLINEGFAEPEEASLSAASSTLSLTTRSPDFSAISSPASASPLMKRARSPHTPENTPNKLDLSLETPKTTSLRPGIEEIDLTTPVRPARKVEEVDLVTPAKDETSRFIDNEKKVHRENGSGDYLRNGNTNGHNKSYNFQLAKSSKIAPAGYESDLSDDADEFELG